MYIDLSHPLNEHISVFPGGVQPSFDPVHTIDKNGWAEKRINMHSHNGTHMDAPCHMLAGTKSLDQYELEKFIGSGVVLDVRGKTAIDLAFLKQNKERIAEVEFILFYLGWQEKWKSSAYFDPYPVLSEAACRYLLDFKLKGIGLDVLSPDPIDASVQSNHHLLLGKDILIIENLCKLDQLLDKSFEFHCLPLPIQDADGAPVRAFARLKD